MIPHPAAAETPSPADQAAEDAGYYRRVLHELIDLGVDLARTVHSQAKAGADDAGAAPELAVAFDRISRAVRRSIALARTLSEPVPARAAASGAAAQCTAARRRIIREVEDAIQREAGGADAEALGAELYERLDAPDLDDDIRDRPVAEVIADICRDLGLLTFLGNHPWKRRTPADLAALSARATAPCATRAPGVGLAPGLTVVPPQSAADSDPAAGESCSDLTVNPTTPLLPAARFRGK